MVVPEQVLWAAMSMKMMLKTRAALDMRISLKARANMARRIKRAMAMSIMKVIEKMEMEKVRKMRLTIMTSYFMLFRHLRSPL